MRMKYILSLFAAALLFAACSQDEMTDSALSDSQYPLTLTASIDGAVTRTTGKDAWDGGEVIGVRMGTDGTAAQYIVDSDASTLSPASADETLYWQGTDPATITAWYPDEAQTSVDISDQSSGFAAFDYLYATATDQMAGSTVNLSFKHQMAKVSYTLKAGESITDDELASATVKIAGYTQASFEEGVLTGAADGWITPASDQEALLVPQDMTGKALFLVSVNGDSYSYNPSTAAEGNLLAGYQKSYAITVNKWGLEVVAVSASWNDSETKADAQEQVFRVYMPEDHGQTLSYSENVTVNDGYLEITGNSLVISYTVKDGEHHKGFPITDGIGTVIRATATVDEDIVYTFTYTMRSDLRLGYDLHAEPEDYYYSDGTWSPYIDDTKTCIGIVFKSGAGPSDDAANYSSLSGNKIHGYAVALSDAHDEAGAWGIRLVDEILDDETRYTDKYNGYTNTWTIYNACDVDAADLDSPTAKGQYWAFKAVKEYSVATPTNSSGWYMPSIGQLQDIYDLTDRATLFTSAGGADFKTSDYNGRYWSSTEYNYYDAWYFQFNGNGADAYAKSSDDDFGKDYLRPSYIRAVLTF